jgi:phosphopantetheine--protein transferase-like protein
MLAAQGISLNLNYLYERRMPQRLSLDVSLEDNMESAPDSMILPLGFPPMSISPRLQQGKTSEATGVPYEANLQQDKNSMPDPADTHRQEPTGELPSLTYSEAAGAGSQGNPIVAQGKNGHLASKAMEDYLATMERFLDTQQQVMNAYLTNGHTITSDEQRAAGQPPVGEINQQIPSVEPPTTPKAEDDGHQSTENASTDSGSITEIILNLVSTRTGYPLEMLDLDLNMEADLGIDSIKRIEILGTFQEQYPALQEKIDVEQVSSLKTLRQIVDFFSEISGVEGTLPAEPGTSTDEETLRGEQDSPASGEFTRSVSATPVVETRSLPFIASIISHIPGSELTVQCLVDLEEAAFLQDHTLGSEISTTDESLKPQCVIPMTVSMEMMAETATRLVPDKLVIGIKDVQAHRWIPVGDKPITLRITARKHTSNTGEEVAVRIWVITDNTDSELVWDSAAVEGTVLFADNYSQPPVIEAFSCRSERLPRHTARELYHEKLMFHGPRFQGVVSLDKSGEDGIIGQLDVLPKGYLFRSNSSPAFIIDPFLLDAAGQLVGYWPLEYLETGFIAFPIRLQGLHLYGPMPHPGERLECRVRIHEVTSQRVRADIDIIGVEKRILMQLIGWEDWRFNLTTELFNFWRFPRTTALSTLWDDPIAGFPAPESFVCCRLNTIRSDQIISKDLWVNLILNRRERETWHNMRGSESRRTKWLMGRWVAKDAVRIFLQRQYGKELNPADIDITADEYGNPLPSGPWTDDIENVPAVSISHTDGLSVAVAGFQPSNQRIGIDIEQIRQRKPEFERLAFVSEEQSLLHSLDEPSREEWITRLWCAKEAVAKALGRGLIEGPQSLAVQELHQHTGVVEVILRGKLAELFPEFAGTRITAHTVRDSNYVAAISICERSQNG